MSKKILIVDDQEIERSALRSILSAEPGWQVQEAVDGAAALDRLCSGEIPQLCIVDLNMPNVGGLEFLRRVRRDRHLRTLKVVVVSAARDRGTIIELAKLVIEGYLLKPFDADRILTALRPIMATFPDADETPAVLQDLLAKTALIADDDPVARAALGALVREELHWQVHEAEDGRAALAQLQAGLRPNLCFVDLQMPGMDGIALVTEMRAHPDLQTLRVAITSAHRDREKIVALAQLRIDGYLLKPLDAGKVRAALRACA